ncbi:hypothetical protein [Dongia sp. agr-C8]
MEFETGAAAAGRGGCGAGWRGGVEMLGATLGSAAFGATGVGSGAFVSAGFTATGFASAAIGVASAATGFASAGAGFGSGAFISGARASTGFAAFETLLRGWISAAGAWLGGEIFGSTRFASTAAEAESAGADGCKPNPARSRLNGVSSTATGSPDPFAEAAFGSRRLPNLNPIIPVSFPTDRRNPTDRPIPSSRIKH